MQSLDLYSFTFTVIDKKFNYFGLLIPRNEFKNEFYDGTWSKKNRITISDGTVGDSTDEDDEAIKGKKMCQCILCSAKFANRGSVYQHIKRVHPDHKFADGARFIVIKPGNKCVKAKVRKSKKWRDYSRPYSTMIYTIIFVVNSIQLSSFIHLMFFHDQLISRVVLPKTWLFSTIALICFHHRIPYHLVYAT